MDRTGDKHGATHGSRAGLFARWAASFAAALLGAVCPGAAEAAGPADRAAQQGLALAKRGDCGKAVPFLEDAELAAHTPATAFALAGCYATMGELVKAAELYHAIAEETPRRTWSPGDKWAAQAARKKAAEVDARIPTLRFTPEHEYKELEIQVGGRTIEDLTKPIRVAPGVNIVVVARAKGWKELTQEVSLGEGEKMVLTISLERAGKADDAGEAEAAPAPKPARPKRPTWIGARFQSFVIPKFMWQFFGDGGRSVFVPGGGFTLTTPTSDADLELFLGYASYHAGDTPWKPSGAPDTDYEIVDSSLQALYASVSLLWSVPLDADKVWSFRVGGGIGVGVMVAGDIHRTQAYAPKGITDPYQYLRCNGPNDPLGSFRYCNQLDRDASHYGGYAEPDWFHHGSRPVVYPLVTVPDLGLSYRPSPNLSVDLRAGLGFSGIVTSLGFRYAL